MLRTTLRSIGPIVLLAWLVAMPGHGARADYDLGIAAREAGDFDVARSLLGTALARGDMRAAMTLAEMAENGEGGVPSRARACGYLEQAAEGGVAEAQYEAGECVREGLLRGGPLDRLRWYEAAAAGGWPAAHCAIGRLYHLGSGVVEDRELGFNYCLRGARAGDPAAMEWVGYLYAEGYGTERDIDAAYAWWERAAAAGDADAAWRLGLAYKNGNSQVEPDPARANRYLRLAFELGELRAAAMLAQLLVPLAVRDDGTVDPRIGTAALFWAGLDSRIDDSAEFRARSAALHDRLAGQAPALVPRAARMIEDWLAAHPELGTEP